MSKFDNLSSANILALNAASDRDRLVVHLFTEMAQKISYLEQEVSKLTDLTAGGLLDPFDERVLEVLNVRSGSCREALELDAPADGLTPFADRVLAVIDENSYTTFTHIEAEIDEKLCDFTDSYSFTEAVAEAVEGSIGEQVKQKLDDILHDAIIDAIGDPEDIVRKGLRSIL
jgi:hypothetical protein